MSSYEIFRKLRDAVELRTSGGRDAVLYRGFKDRLGMAAEQPKAFFAAHSEVSEQRVVEAFLETFEPFARMVETIFAVCAEVKKKATGGADLELRFDGSSSSLRFDARNFLHFREVMEQVRTMAAEKPRWHSDLVPMYSWWARHVMNVPRSANVGLPPLDPANVAALLERARAVGEAHLAMLGDTNHDWSGAIARGLQGLQAITVEDVLTSRDAVDDVARLREILAGITERTAGWTWQKALQSWLQLPFWKKRCRCTRSGSPRNACARSAAQARAPPRRNSSCERAPRRRR